MNVATEIDTVEAAQPLEITSLRGDAGARRPRAAARARRRRGRRRRAGVAIAAAVNASDVAIGPGRVLVCVLVAAWSARRGVRRALRPREPLSWIMVARRRGRCRRRARRSARSAGPATTDDASAVLATSRPRCSSRSAFHLALGLPDGTLVHRIAARHRDRRLRRRDRPRGRALRATVPRFRSRRS